MAQAALSYIEPGILTILIQSSFLILLNALNHILDRLIYCGLLGQILLGVAYGVPGASWLSVATQSTFMDLGYLGLILIVYEGGLSTSIPALLSNLHLSITVAILGICTPISLSFILLYLLPCTPLQAFAAGAALCSTSLGTTFTILQTSGLEKSRMGVIISSAAMLDDVVGLVMVKVISGLGTAGGMGVLVVVRPVVVSLGFGVLVPVVCVWVLRPLTRWVLDGKGKERGWRRCTGWCDTPMATLALHTFVLVGLVAASSYAGTSNLFAAYIAGAVVTWWDTVVVSILEGGDGSLKKKTKEKKKTTPLESSERNSNITEPTTQIQTTTPTVSPQTQEQPKIRKHENTGLAIYERFYAPALTTILKPFFFASIGFSIPITQMFAGHIVWRGMTYTLLMLLGKLICGLVLVRFDTTSTLNLPARPSSSKIKNTTEKKPVLLQESADTSTSAARNDEQLQQQQSPEQANTSRKRKVPRPKSLYPALMLGGAMVARGEIGFLISSLAESKGVFGGGGGTQDKSSDIFLVVSWAVLLCTFVGPLGIGLLVGRVGRLREKRRKGRGADGDPLGGWGVEI